MISYDVIWYHMMSYDIIWCHMMSYDIIWYHMMSYDVIWCHMISYDIIWYIMTYMTSYDIKRPCDPRENRKICSGNPQKKVTLKNMNNHILLEYKRPIRSEATQLMERSDSTNLFILSLGPHRDPLGPRGRVFKLQGPGGLAKGLKNISTDSNLS